MDLGVGDADRLRRGQFFGEVQRCRLERACSAVLVQIGPGEFLGRRWRRAEGEGQDEVDFSHHLLFDTIYVCSAGSGFGQRAELERIFTELGSYDTINCCRSRCIEAVWVEDLWNEAIFLDQVEDHVPLPTITDGAA